ncbi:MAG TPA: hypothetical protein VJT81_17545 [Burkholderiales bacterium]|nr:hypothetical protein [Burkholderiales bacterium]
MLLPAMMVLLFECSNCFGIDGPDAFLAFAEKHASAKFSEVMQVLQHPDAPKHPKREKSRDSWRKMALGEQLMKGTVLAELTRKGELRAKDNHFK